MGPFEILLKYFPYRNFVLGWFLEAVEAKTPKTGRDRDCRYAAAALCSLIYGLQNSLQKTLHRIFLPNDEKNAAHISIYV